MVGEAVGNGKRKGHYIMEQNPRRRFWMLGPMVIVALVLGVLLGKGWERTGHATETYEELKTFSEVLTQVQKMRGPKGSKVNLTIQRDGTPDPLQFTLVRDTIKIESVKSKVLDNIGYVRLTQFQESTGRDLSKVLKQFKDQKLLSTILDL